MVVPIHKQLLSNCYELHKRDAIICTVNVGTIANASDMCFADALVGYGTEHVARP